jgi:GNAT superfamily N-acetyltransferase
MATRIRLASLSDADTLASLIQDVQRLHADAIPRLFKPPGDATLFADDFRERILSDQDSHAFIAEVDGAAAGYVVAIIIRRPETPYNYALKAVHIDQIAVRPAYQRGGCGRALIQAVFDLARNEGIERVNLNTWAFNHQAHTFFQRLGFEFTVHRMDTLLPFEEGKSS